MATRPDRRKDSTLPNTEDARRWLNPRDSLTPAQQHIYDAVTKGGRKTGGDLKPILDAYPCSAADRAAVHRAFSGE